MNEIAHEGMCQHCGAFIFQNATYEKHGKVYEYVCTVCHQWTGIEIDNELVFDYN